jgi:hypothetical protein
MQELLLGRESATISQGKYALGKVTDGILAKPQDNIAVSYFERVSQTSSYGFDDMLKLCFVHLLSWVMSLNVYRFIRRC